MSEGVSKWMFSIKITSFFFSFVRMYVCMYVCIYTCILIYLYYNTELYIYNQVRDTHIYNYSQHEFNYAT